MGHERIGDVDHIGVDGADSAFIVGADDLEVKALTIVALPQAVRRIQKTVDTVVFIRLVSEPVDYKAIDAGCPGEENVVLPHQGIAGREEFEEAGVGLSAQILRFPVAQGGIGVGTVVPGFIPGQNEFVAAGILAPVAEIGLPVVLLIGESDDVLAESRGQEIPFRQGRDIDIDAILAGQERSEEVLAFGIGELLGGLAGVDLLEAEENIGDSRFARILQAVAVDVEPDEIADAAIIGAVAEIGIAAVLIRSQAERHGIVVGAGDVAARQGRFIDADDVAARHDIIEEIVAVFVRDRLRDRIAEGIGEDDTDAGQAHFISILHPVVTVVFPDIVADGGQFDEAGIPGGIMDRQAQTDFRGQAGGPVGVAVESVIVACIRLSEDIVRRQDEFDRIGIGDKIRKVVESIGSGPGRIDDDTVCIEQHDRDIFHRGFIRILDTVHVEIIPDIVAERGELIETGAPGEIVLSLAQHRQGGAAVALAGVAVEHAGGIRREQGQCVSGRRHEAEEVGSRCQTAEEESAIRSRNLLRQNISGGIVQTDSYAGHRQFTVVIEAIAVTVKPGIAAEGSQLEVDTGIP